MKKIDFLIFFVLIVQPVFSQSNSYHYSNDFVNNFANATTCFSSIPPGTILPGSADLNKKKNALFVQFFGEGTNYSLNYQRVFAQSKTAYYSYTTGFSFHGRDVYFPLSIDAFTQGKLHQLNLGMGIIPFVVHHTFKSGVDSDKQLFIIPKVGYKLQKAGKGLFFAVYGGPRILIDPPSTNIFKFTTAFISPTIQLEAGIAFY